MGKQARYQSRELRHAKAVAARRRHQRNRLLAGVGGVVIVALLVAIVVTLVQAAGRKRPVADASKPVVPPATATAGGAIAVGKPDAPVRLEVYLDYMCPYCGRFERANGGELDKLVADGTIRVELYLLSFLDQQSHETRYSTRAANAVATVADRAPDKVLAFNNALFARQPAEGSAGLSDDEIAKLAAGAGVPQDVVGAFAAGTFEPWVAKFTKSAFDSGITGTPTVKVDGVVFKGDLYNVGPLTAAITAAKER
jgi:protein-disulfide isomerase